MLRRMLEVLRRKVVEEREGLRKRGVLFFLGGEGRGEKRGGLRRRGSQSESTHDGAKRVLRLEELRIPLEGVSRVEGSLFPHGVSLFGEGFAIVDFVVEESLEVRGAVVERTRDLRRQGRRRRRTPMV